MELVEHGHACVVLCEGERRLGIDPGVFTDPDAFDGPTAVLVTHEHRDQFAPDRLRAALDHDPALEVWTNGSVAGRLDGPAGRVRRGRRRAGTIAGFPVHPRGDARGDPPGDPAIPDIGFLVDGTVFHPGDALTVPDEPVATLPLPPHTPWSRTADLVDYVRAVHADQAYAVHDGLLDDAGLGVVAGLLGERGPGTPTPFSRLAPGDSVEL
jgi:L-ascorbate metabolism protein UlaG (beta-lactamase superfamily)